MKIEFRNVSTSRRNCRAEMFFDGIRVATICCTPEEFVELHERTYRCPCGHQHCGCPPEVRP